ncbi:MAG: FAD-dependent oxidoreductase [Clostridia bacterium]|nr:FAD-dependent oxidoreductase [Clostridia bacterium]
MGNNLEGLFSPHGVRDGGRFDVAVIGGGTAGAFAAASAADAGAKTLLIEKNGVLGGTMTVGGVSFPGLFFAWGEQIIGGKCWDLIKRAEELGGADIPEMIRVPKHHFDLQIRLNPFVWAAALDEMINKYGVKLLLHTMLADACPENGGVALILAQKDGMKKVRAKKIVDCTADADAVRMLGFPVEKSTSLQPATLYVRGTKLDPQPDLDALGAEAEKALEDGRLPPWVKPRSCVKLVKGLDISYHVDCPADADGSEGKTRLEVAARRDALKVAEFIRAFPGCEKFTFDAFAPECGVRETCRIVGETVVTADDYISGRVFPDAVCNAFYPIDRHKPPYAIHQVFFKEGEYATVPYSALIPRGSDDVLAAGRCISADADALSALRVQAVCMATGQAAGCAAAIAAGLSGSVREVDIKSLRAELKRQNAILPKEIKE